MLLIAFALQLTVIVMSSGGPVTTGEAASTRRVSARQPIQAGETVHVPAGATATLLCSSDWMVSVTGPKDWVVDAKACQQGRALPGGSYDSLAVEGGRIRSMRGGMTVEFDTRGEAASGVPIVLAPRNTAVLDPRPTVVWTEVPGAVQYEIEWLGAGGTPLKVKAADAGCVAGAGFWRGLRTCSASYPGDRAPLKAGAAPVFLRVSSRFGIASPARSEKDAAKVRVLSEEEARKFRERLDALQQLPVDADGRRLLVAGAYASAGFLGEALSRYDEALARQELAEARVTLGDVALAIGLPELAAREYRQVIERKTAPPAATVAAAELGLGRAAFALSSFSAARDHFERARELFAGLDLAQDAVAAKAGAERAAARVPR